jgi:para-nitrobenzyl esterase
MPAAKGLFHKAISMSGAAGLNVDPAEAMEPYSNALLKELSIDRTNLSALQDLTYEDLLKARSRAVASSGLEGARPVIDGRHIVTRPMSAEGLKAHANIPLMLGHTETEASLFFRDDMRNFTLTEAQMRTRMRKAFNIDDNTVGSIMDAYRKDAPGMTPSDILIATTSDVQFTLPLTQAARIKSGAEGQAPVYMYNFAWEIPWNGGVLGSPHAVDIPFAFGTVDAAGAMTGTGDGAIEASLNLMSAFVNFARTGNPNNSRLPNWQPYGSGSRTTMVIDTQCNAVNDRRGAALAAIANLKIDPFNRAALYRYGDG